MNTSIENLNRNIRWILTIVMCGLMVSGLTALPIEWELQLANAFSKDLNGDLTFPWLEMVYRGVRETNVKYPFISYGTDWLAFAHFMLAVAFIGPWRDPIRNIWVIEFGILACLLIFPFAFIAGTVRGIPVYWRLIDCSFGFFGGILLWYAYSKTKQLESLIRKPL